MTITPQLPDRIEVAEALYDIARRNGSTMSFDAVSQTTDEWIRRVDFLQRVCTGCSAEEALVRVLAATDERTRRWACRAPQNYMTAVDITVYAASLAQLEVPRAIFFDARHPSARNLLRALMASSKTRRAAMLTRCLHDALDDNTVIGGAITDTYYAMGSSDVSPTDFFDLTRPTVTLWADVVSGNGCPLTAIANQVRRDLIVTDPSRAHLDPSTHQVARMAVSFLAGHDPEDGLPHRNTSGSSTT